MDNSTNKELYRLLKNYLTEGQFLQRTGISLKTMQAVFKDADLKSIAEELAAQLPAELGQREDPVVIPLTAAGQTPINCIEVITAMMPLLKELNKRGVIDDSLNTDEYSPLEWMEYTCDVILSLLFPNMPKGEISESDHPAALIICEVLHTVLTISRKHRRLIPTFDIDMLRKAESDKYPSGDEYYRLLRGNRKKYVYEFHVMASQIRPFNTLGHVAGVHYVAMHMARQLAKRQVPVDLALISAAAATHDIGKFGCKDDEIVRLPHLHYYYTDEFLLRMGLPGIAHVASNHSTWDLELENLSCENLLLIYADFRVKSTHDDNGDEVINFYSLEDAFDVILSKLENVDSVKRNRYERVYAKLHDFEQYMISIGVSPELGEIPESEREWKDAALLNAEQAKDRLKYLAIEHNINVMHRFESLNEFTDLLEEARSGGDWSNIHAYLNTLEEYYPYVSTEQKRLTITFLRELLINRGGDIRRQSAALIGKIIASYDEKYRKELPSGIQMPSGRINSVKLWKEHLQIVTEPDLKRTERQHRWIGYSLKSTMSTLLTSADDVNRAQYLEQFIEILDRKGRSDTAIFILLDTTLEMEMTYLNATHIQKILEFCRQVVDIPVTEVQISVLRILRKIAAEVDWKEMTKSFRDNIEELLEFPVEEGDLVSVTYLRYKTREALGLKDKLTEKYREKLNILEATNTDIFRDDLKTDTQWVIKAVNIEVMLDEVRSGRRQEVFYIATHLANLLKVSERVTVRRRAGKSLLEIIDLLNRDQRQEVVIELTKGLEIGDYQFSKYIPEYLGVLIMHMYPEELNEVLYELKHLLEGGNEKVTSVTLQTLGVMLQNYSDYQGRFHEEDKVFLRRRDVIIGMLLSGMANYHEAVSREGFLVLGKMIFGTDQLTLETKAEIFKVLHKKMLTLIEDREGDTLRFFNNAACLNHIYRFISDYQFFFGSLPLKEVDKAAFFPGTFDPFSQGHKGIVTAIRDEGYEVYLALDEFSWSKNTQAREYRKKIMNMSCADEPGVYIFPDDQPINIANPEDIRKLKNLFDGKEVFIVVGSDVIANASSYQKKPEIDSIHSLNHIVFRRESMEQKTEGKRSYEENLEKITGKVIELTLPTHLEDISSSKIRDNIDNNRDVASLIDPIAQSYIYDNALYMRQPMYKFILSAKSLNFDSQRNENGLNRCVITDESRGDAVIAEALAHNVESARLYNEFDNLELASFVREKAAGRILVIHRINADKSAIEEDACQLIITEVLSEALKDDYTYAVFHDREFQDKSAKEQKYIIDVLLRQGFKEIIINERATGCYGVNMSCPVTLIQNMNTVLKAPFNKNSQVQKALVKAHKRLQQSLVAMFPDTLILSYDSTVMHHKLIRMITQENGVPSEEQEKRVLGPYMCVPFGKILNGMAAPNTVTKTLHMEKSFSPNLENFRIKEYPNYASIENQVRTIKSFHRPVILVDDILHKGYRMRCLDPILNDNDVKVHKILVGILSGIGRDLMNLQGREIDSAYFVPNLNAWFVESTLYPFIGGDGVERHTGTIDDDFTSINMILPYMIPSFLARRCTKEAIYDYSMVCLENARDIMKVLEEEYQKIFQKKLTLQRLSEAIHSPKLTDVGQCLDFDRALAASSYIEDDIERLQRMRGLLL